MMETVFTWMLPALFVAMMIWTILKWRQLENVHRWIAIIPLIFIFYVMVR